jgi:hypothetical protein
MARLIGGAPVVLHGIRFQQVPVARVVAKYGRIHNARVGPAVAGHGARTWTGIMGWRKLSGN